jgi:hypothetical protein
MTEEPMKAPFELHVSLDDMLMGDLETLEDPTLGVKALLDLLQRMVVGADIRKMPLTMLPAIRKAIIDKVRDLGNSKN